MVVMLGEGREGEGRVDGSEVGRMERGWEGGKDGEREDGREGVRNKGGSEPLSKEPRTFSTVFGTGMKLVS